MAMGDRITPTAPPSPAPDDVLDGIDGQIGPIDRVLSMGRRGDGGETAEEWALVHTGLLSDQPHLVPLHRAERQGNRVLVPYDRATVETSPPPLDIDTPPAGGYLAALTAHYTGDEHRLAPTNQEILDRVDTTGPQDTDASTSP